MKLKHSLPPRIHWTCGGHLADSKVFNAYGNITWSDLPQGNFQWQHLHGSAPNWVSVLYFFSSGLQLPPLLIVM